MLISIVNEEASWKKKQSPPFCICVWGKRRDRDVIVFESLLRFQNVFFPHENAKPAFSDSFGLQSIFEKLRFRDGLVWTVGLTREIKLRFQIPPA